MGAMPLRKMLSSAAGKGLATASRLQQLHWASRGTFHRRDGVADQEELSEFRTGLSGRNAAKKFQRTGVGDHRILDPVVNTTHSASSV